MLTRETVCTMLMLRNREGTLFSKLPMEMIQHIITIDDMSEDVTYLRIAFKLARSGTTEDMLLLAAMVEHKPHMLFQRCVFCKLAENTQIMDIPMLLSDGHHYDKTSITQLLETDPNAPCPQNPNVAITALFKDPVAPYILDYALKNRVEELYKT